MITIFTIPRPFVGKFDYIQRNAIRSWLRLEPTPEILLFGRERGVQEAARDFGGLPVYTTERSEHGTPLVNKVLWKAQAIAHNDILVMANADNLYLSDFIPAILGCARAFPRFLMIGQRWDAEVSGLLEFGQGWEKSIRQRTIGLHAKAAVDYLVFRDGAWWQDMPGFAVGRSSYDGWMVAKTRAAGVPVVDATGALTVVHQNHAISPDAEYRENEALYDTELGRGGVGQAGWELIGSQGTMQ